MSERESVRDVKFLGTSVAGKEMVFVVGEPGAKARLRLAKVRLER